jgi:hypothetical protein
VKVGARATAFAGEVSGGGVVVGGDAQESVVGSYAMVIWPLVREDAAFTEAFVAPAVMNEDPPPPPEMELPPPPAP